MRSSLAGPLTLVLSLTVALPAAAQTVVQGAEHCVVNVASDDPLNLRAGPGSGHPVLSRHAYASCGLVVTGPCKGSWCPVEDGHYAGWAHRRFIAAVSEPDQCVRTKVRNRKFALRAWPADTSRVLTSLPQGTCGIALLPYKIVGWQKVRHDGWEGWVSTADLVRDER